MVSTAMICLNIENERRLNLLPVQAFADDIVMCSHNIIDINEMLEVS